MRLVIHVLDGPSFELEVGKGDQTVRWMSLAAADRARRLVSMTSTRGRSLLPSSAISSGVYALPEHVDTLEGTQAALRKGGSTTGALAPDAILNEVFADGDEVVLRLASKTRGRGVSAVAAQGARGMGERKTTDDESGKGGLPVPTAGLGVGGGRFERELDADGGVCVSAFQDAAFSSKRTAASAARRIGRAAAARARDLAEPIGDSGAVRESLAGAAASDPALVEVAKRTELAGRGGFPCYLNGLGRVTSDEEKTEQRPSPSRSRGATEIAMDSKSRRRALLDTPLTSMILAVRSAGLKQGVAYEGSSGAWLEAIDDLFDHDFAHMDASLLLVKTAQEKKNSTRPRRGALVRAPSFTKEDGDGMVIRAREFLTTETGDTDGASALASLRDAVFEFYPALLDLYELYSQTLTSPRHRKVSKHHIHRTQTGPRKGKLAASLPKRKTLSPTSSPPKKPSPIHLSTQKDPTKPQKEETRLHRSALMALLDDAGLRLGRHQYALLRGWQPAAAVQATEEFAEGKSSVDEAENKIYRAARSALGATSTDRSSETAPVKETGVPIDVNRVITYVLACRRLRQLEEELAVAKGGTLGVDAPERRGLCDAAEAEATREVWVDRGSFLDVIVIVASLCDPGSLGVADEIEGGDGATDGVPSWVVKSDLPGAKAAMKRGTKSALPGDAAVEHIVANIRGGGDERPALLREDEEQTTSKKEDSSIQSPPTKSSSVSASPQKRISSSKQLVGAEAGSVLFGSAPAVSLRLNESDDWPQLDAERVRIAVGHTLQKFAVRHLGTFARNRSNVRSALFHRSTLRTQVTPHLDRLRAVYRLFAAPGWMLDPPTSTPLILSSSSSATTTKKKSSSSRPPKPAISSPTPASTTATSSPAAAGSSLSIGKTGRQLLRWTQPGPRCLARGAVAEDLTELLPPGAPPPVAASSFAAVAPFPSKRLPLAAVSSSSSETSISIPLEAALRETGVVPRSGPLGPLHTTTVLQAAVASYLCSPGCGGVADSGALVPRRPVDADEPPLSPPLRLPTPTELGTAWASVLPSEALVSATFVRARRAAAGRMSLPRFLQLVEHVFGDRESSTTSPVFRSSMTDAAADRLGEGALGEEGSEAELAWSVVDGEVRPSWTRRRLHRTSIDDVWLPLTQRAVLTAFFAATAPKETTASPWTRTDLSNIHLSSASSPSDDPTSATEPKGFAAAASTRRKPVRHAQPGAEWLLAAHDALHRRPGLDFLQFLEAIARISLAMTPPHRPISPVEALARSVDRILVRRFPGLDDPVPHAWDLAAMPAASSSATSATQHAISSPLISRALTTPYSSSPLEAAADDPEVALRLTSSKEAPLANKNRPCLPDIPIDILSRFAVGMPDAPNNAAAPPFLLRDQPFGTGIPAVLLPFTQASQLNTTTLAKRCPNAIVVQPQTPISPDEQPARDLILLATVVRIAIGSIIAISTFVSTD